MSAGAWLGVGLAQLYARFFSFPFLVFTRDPQIYGLAAIVTVAAAVRGRHYAVRAVADAAARRGHVAAGARRTTGQAVGPSGGFWPCARPAVMVARHLLRWPFRTVSGILGVAMSVAILVASLWSFGSIDHMIDVTFSRAERHDADRGLRHARTDARAVFAARQMPGVLVAEPFRAVAARISHRNLSSSCRSWASPPSRNCRASSTPTCARWRCPRPG